MKKINLYLFFIFITLSVSGQNQYQKYLIEIDQNSTLLETLRKKAEAQKIANRTNIYLPNPEIEFGHLWGAPGSIGGRTDLNIRQSFDFPTTYMHKSDLANLENTNVELYYKTQRTQLLLSAQEICVNLTYYNAIERDYKIRMQNAEQILTNFQTRAANGDANILDVNKAQLNLTNMKTEIANIVIEKERLHSELRRLNGGKDISFTDTAFQNIVLPIDFETWYSEAESKNPALSALKKDIEIAQQKIKLARATVLPKFNAGFASETTKSPSSAGGTQSYNGLTVGLSIPLWENKNKVKLANADANAAVFAAEDAKLQFFVILQNLFEKAKSLRNTAQEYQKSLASTNNSELLYKALDSGEISLLNYLLEIQYYYDANMKALGLERELGLTAAKLFATDL